MNAAPPLPPSLPAWACRALDRILQGRATPPDLPFDAWAHRYLGAYLTDAPSGFHTWLAAELNALCGRRGTRLNIVAPRGSAKSTWAAEAYPLWQAVYGREPYIIIASDSSGQAEKRLSVIRGELETNERLAADYPEVAGKPPICRLGQIELQNGVVIEAAGTGQKIRGRKNRQHRPSLIVVDDPQSTEHTVSALQRQRSWEWLTKDVCNAGDPQTNIVVLGTALHRECIVCKLQTTPGWRSHVFKALAAWPDRMDLWTQWEGLLHDFDLPDEQREARARAFYEAKKKEMDAGTEGKLLWPAREPLYELMKLRATIGVSAFASEKQGDPINPESCEWPSDYFDGPGFWFEDWPNRPPIAKSLALDPSKGADSRIGDYSAYVKLAVYDSPLQLYVEADVKRRDTAQIVADGVEHVRLWHPNWFCLETNAYQSLFAPEFLRVAEQEKVLLPLYGINNTENKQVRIRRLTPYLSQRQLRFKARSPGTLLLVQQLKDFPQGDHDDGPDALEMAVRLAAEALLKKRRPSAANQGRLTC